MSLITKIVEENQLAAESATALSKAFEVYLGDLEMVQKEVYAIQVTDASQKDEMKHARTLRLALKEKRVATEKLRKEMKSESLRYGRAVDQAAKLFTEPAVQMEEYLQRQEDFVQIQEELKRTELYNKRLQQLQPYPTHGLSEMIIKESSEEAFAALLVGFETRAKAEKEEQEQLEKERVETEQRRVEEEARLKVENERLRAEQKAREEELAIERQKAIQAQQKAQAAHIESERLARERAQEAETQKEDKRLEDIAVKIINTYNASHSTLDAIQAIKEILREF